MSERMTTAGRRLITQTYGGKTRSHEQFDYLHDAILAIEAEAATDERERLLAEPVMDAVRELVDAARADLVARIEAAMATLPRVGYQGVYGTPSSGWAIPEQSVLAAIREKAAAPAVRPAVLNRDSPEEAIRPCPACGAPLRETETHFTVEGTI